MSEPENQDNAQEQDDQNFPMEIENGHITDSNSGGEPDSSEDENLQLINSTTGEYDRDIPTTHGYLGKLDSLSGYTLFEDGEVHRNIFAIYTNTLVFPGFTLPLVMNNMYENRVMQDFIDRNNKVFVLLCANSGYSGLNEYGVTMEIFETNKRNDLIYVKARGRQRCKRVPGSKIESVVGRIKFVTVQVLAETPIISPLEDSQLLALKTRRKWNLHHFDDLKECKKFRSWHSAQFSFPAWVYDMNEVSYYTKVLLDGLSSFGTEYIPTDPEKLSYWFVQNFHLSHKERLKILSLSCTLERLKLECIFLRLPRVMCCDSCGAHITDPSKIFVMSKDGIQSNYVNPGGHVYETVTVLALTNFQLVGKASRQFSWFPGYSWTIIQCTNCNNHLGWKFSSATLTPKEFYGLAKSGFKIVSHKSWPDFEELRHGKISYADDYIGL